MKKLKLMTLVMCVLTIFGCATKQGTGALIGTGGGAIIGAVIGKMAGNTAVGAAIGGAVGAGAGALIGRHMDKVAKEAAQVQNAQVEQVTDANGLQAVKVTFDSGILFQSGKSDLSASAKTSLTKFATVLKDNADCDISVQGYTDNDPWKGMTAEQSVQRNQQLSQDRAGAVTGYLLGQGVASKQIKSTMGYGEQNPVADNSTAAGKAQNRRVEVYMYASQAMVDAANNGTLK